MGSVNIFDNLHVLTSIMTRIILKNFYNIYYQLISLKIDNFQRLKKVHNINYEHKILQNHFYV